MDSAWFLWAAAAVVTVIATAWATRPLWRPGMPARAGSDREARLQVLRDRRAEIDADEAEGRLDAAAAADARQELVDTLAAELARDDGDRAGGSARSTRVLAGISALVVAAVAIGLYAAIGAPGIDARLDQATTDEHRAASQVARMVAETRARLNSNPRDGAAWADLAQLNAIRGDFDAASDAYERAAELLPPDARLLADHAEVIALSQDRSFAGRPEALLRRAIAIDADDPKVNGLLGAALFQQGRLEEALPHLQKVLGAMDPSSEQAAQIRSLIAGLQARSAAGAAPGAPPGPVSGTPPGVATGDGGPSPLPDAAAAGGGSTAAAAGTRIEGVVQLAGAAPEPGTILFITVRAAQGPRMPFAVRRVEAPRFPHDFSLGPDDLMTAERPLPSGQPVVVEARLSRSGQAIRQPGDRIGQSEPLTLPSAPVTIIIDQVVP